MEREIRDKGGRRIFIFFVRVMPACLDAGSDHEGGRRFIVGWTRETWLDLLIWTLVGSGVGWLLPNGCRHYWLVGVA